MKNTLLTALFLSSSFFAAQNAFAAEDNIEVTPMHNVTNHELAAIYVLSEICPSMVSDQAKFNAGYQKLAKEYLPTENNPVARLELLSQQANFKSILAEAQNDAKAAGDDKNQQICEELTSYSNEP